MQDAAPTSLTHRVHALTLTFPIIDALLRPLPLQDLPLPRGHSATTDGDVWPADGVQSFLDGACCFAAYGAYFVHHPRRRVARVRLSDAAVAPAAHHSNAAVSFRATCDTGHERCRCFEGLEWRCLTRPLPSGWLRYVRS